MNNRSLLDLPVSARGLESLVFAPVALQHGDALIELALCLDRIDSGQYLYSKLYYSVWPDADFSESAVICFEIRFIRRVQLLQIALPETALHTAYANNYLRLRVDGLPYSKGAWSLLSCRFVALETNEVLAAEARRRAHRQWVREQVLVSEASQREYVPHYPESLSLELTSLCNLQCPHCSSHGMPHLHRHHNLRSEMPVNMLRRIADEVFPHVSVISLVGRGEPTLASDELWGTMIELLRQNDVRLSCVTNGTRLEKRFDVDLMPWVHEIIFSVDGASEETFAHNRQGASFAAVMSNIRCFHEMRTRSEVARRPQLTVSWTLKENNLAELQTFIYLIAPFEPDLLSIRHMVIFQDKERSQSLLNDPVRTNKHLRKIYSTLELLNIRHESPPLIADANALCGTLNEVDKVSMLESREDIQCNWMHRTALIMSDGEVTSCGKHYGARVGYLDAKTSLWDVWNGSAMRSLRASYGTSEMWEQCRHCWLREIKWSAQRRARDASRDYPLLEKPTDFTQSAWDYREYSEL